ncbi:MAG: hypothetical protein CVU56_00545, partial [Deltaproteobacteria bacterium HGW-Deltaproteobacteria-14]
MSLVVQALPSSQGAVLAALTQPRAGSQLSSVQTLPSSQSGGAPPTQTPAAQMSSSVQGSPSSQGAVLTAVAQPLAGSQLSSVQGLPSSQCRAAPPTQTPAEQVSLVVQAEPSSQGAVLFVWTQPIPGSQLSSVHGLPSSQSVAAPLRQAPARQASAVVQGFPSSQLAVLSALTQPRAGSQLSSVQTLPSSQSGAAPPT